MKTLLFFLLCVGAHAEEFIAEHFVGTWKSLPMKNGNGETVESNDEYIFTATEFKIKTANGTRTRPVVLRYSAKCEDAKTPIVGAGFYQINTGMRLSYFARFSDNFKRLEIEGPIDGERARPTTVYLIKQSNDAVEMAKLNAMCRADWNEQRTPAYITKRIADLEDRLKLAAERYKNDLERATRDKDAASIRIVEDTYKNTVESLNSVISRQKELLKSQSKN